MRKGLLDVLPKNALEDLTAEDFRLLVNGCGEVNVQMLISFTSFNDESGMAAHSGSLLCLHPFFCFLRFEANDRLSYLMQRLVLLPTGESADKLLQFKRWFWSIVEKMSMTERQDLVNVFFIFKYTWKERPLNSLFNMVSYGGASQWARACQSQCTF